MNKVELLTPFGAAATIYHQGAHVTSWIPSVSLGEQLFVAKQSEFLQGKAIRGGVPICFPQFGAFGPGVKHGFARISEWQLDHVEQDQTCAIFRLTESPQTLELWPHAFELQLAVTLEFNKLILELTVTNTDRHEWSFSGALHSYFRVANFRDVSLSNLAGVNFWDNGTPLDNKKCLDDQVLKLDGALDRVYFDAPNQLQLMDRGIAKMLVKQGFSDVVVWNPGPAGAQALKDMGDEEYHQMLCVEAAVVDKPIHLAPDASWSGLQAVEIRVKP